MVTFTQMDVNPEAKRYFHYYFENIGGLCAATLRDIETKGEIRALVPAGTSRERALRFKVGGLNDYDLDGRWLLPHVLDYLNRNPEGVFVLQDIWATAGDVKALKPSPLVSRDGQVVYYVLTSSTATVDAIESVLANSISIVVAMFLIPHCPVLEIPEGSASGDEFMISAASSVSEVILPSYDDETYLVWRRSPEVVPDFTVA